MKRNDEAGFTLISVILAVAILSIGIMALGRSQTLLVRAQATSAQRDIALGIARNYIEEVRSRTAIPASEGAGGGGRDRHGRARAATTGARSPSRTSATTSTRPRASVTYPRGPRPIEIVTLIYR